MELTRNPNERKISGFEVIKKCSKIRLYEDGYMTISVQ